MTSTLYIGELASVAAPRSDHTLLRKNRTIKLAAAHQRKLPAYGADDLARLTFVHRARDIGFSINQVRNLLDLSDHREQDCCTVNMMTQQHLTTIEQKIADLTALKQQFALLLASCHDGTVANYRVIDALTPRLRHSAQE